MGTVIEGARKFLDERASPTALINSVAREVYMVGHVYSIVIFPSDKPTIAIWTNAAGAIHQRTEVLRMLQPQNGVSSTEGAHTHAFLGGTGPSLWHGLIVVLLATFLIFQACKPTDTGRSLPDSQREFELSMTLERTIELPERFAFAGAMFFSPDTVLVWDRSGQTVLISAYPAPITTYYNSSTARIVGMGVSRGTVYVLDSAAKAVQSISAKTSDRCAIPLTEVHSGLLGDDGHWYVAGRNSVGELAVVWTSEKDCMGHWGTVVLGKERPGILSRRMGHGVRFSFLDPSFGAIVIAAGKSESRSEVPTQRDLELMGVNRDTLGQWAGLSRFDVDSVGTSVQLLADTRSEHRRLVLRRADGRVIRMRDLNGIWGLVASSSSLSRFLAVHQASGTRLLLYHWRRFEK